MDCFVLGTGGMMPMPHRRLTSLALRIEGELYLFDCGEGTQIPYKELHLGLRSLNTVIVTHLHADHVLGLPGLLMLRAQMPDPQPLTLIGPPGLGRFINNVKNDLRMHVRYPIEFIEWSKDGGGLAYEDERIKLFWRPLRHSAFCLGYRLEEHMRPGRFDPEAARALGVPHGPLFGRLQRGETVQTPEGVEVKPQQVMGPPRRGRQIAFITDTLVTEAMQPLMHEVDVAFVESMFLPEHEEDAREKKHMTVEQAARAAVQARVKRLVLVHISPRYENREVKTFGKLARSIHQDAAVAREKEAITISLPE